MTNITDYIAYKSEIVDKDHAEFLTDDGNLRAAFHSAISLFHLHDWVYAAHKQYIDANFTFLREPAPGQPLAATPVTRSPQFADALADVSAEFALVRGVANSAKHLALWTPDPKRPPPPPNAPSNAANTFPQGSGWGQGTYGSMKYGGTPTVMLEGANNQHLVLSNVTTSVMQMWQSLFAQHHW